MFKWKLYFFILYITILSTSCATITKTSKEYVSEAEWTNATEIILTFQENNNDTTFSYSVEDIILYSGEPVIIKVIQPIENQEEHYFHSPTFFRASATRKIQTAEVEFKSPLFRSVELATSITSPIVAEIFVVPIEVGNYEFFCVRSGHASSGERGEINIKKRSPLDDDLFVTQEVSTLWDPALLDDPRRSSDDPIWDNAKTIEIELTEAGDNSLSFNPQNIDLEVDKAYILEITKSSDTAGAHYFSSEDLYATSVWRKAQDGVVEVKFDYLGEIELRSGTGARLFSHLYFIPTQIGEYDSLCTIDGHAERGMVGTVSVVPPQVDSNSRDREDDNTLIGIVGGSVGGFVLVALLSICFFVVIAFIVAIILVVIVVAARRRRKTKLFKMEEKERKRQERLSFGDFTITVSDSQLSKNIPLNFEGLLSSLPFIRVVATYALASESPLILRAVVLFYASLGRLNEMMISFLQNEIKKSKRTLLFRQTTAFTSMFRWYCLLDGCSYLDEHLSYVVENNLSIDDVDFQNEHDSSLSKLQLQIDILRVINVLCDSVDEFPKSLRRLFTLVRAELNENYTLNDTTMAPLIGSLVFLQYICAALSQPHLFGMVEEPVEGHHADHTVQICSILQKIANGSTFGKGKKHNTYSSFIKEHQGRVNDFLLEVSSPSTEEFDPIVIPPKVREKAVAVLYQWIDDNKKEIYHVANHQHLGADALAMFIDTFGSDLSISSDEDIIVDTYDDSINLPHKSDTINMSSGHKVRVKRRKRKTPRSGTGATSNSNTERSLHLSRTGYLTTESESSESSSSKSSSSSSESSSESSTSSTSSVKEKRKKKKKKNIKNTVL